MAAIIANEPACWAGLLTAGNSSSWQWTCNDEVMATISLWVTAADRVRLDYRNRSARHNGGEWEPMQYTVLLDWTPCAFGGRRVWWRCPAVGCGRRVAVLHGGRVFACRQCDRLAYRCQREADDDRATRRADTIRRRLGWEVGILNGNGLKPKGMHWRTFERLQAEHDAHVNAAMLGIAAKLKLLGGGSTESTTCSRMKSAPSVGQERHWKFERRRLAH